MSNYVFRGPLTTTCFPAGFIADPDVSSSAKALMARLGTEVDLETGRIDYPPSVSDLGQALGSSVEVIEILLEELQVTEYLVVEPDGAYQFRNRSRPFTDRDMRIAELQAKGDIEGAAALTLGISVDEVRKSIAELERQGYISVDRDG